LTRRRRTQISNIHSQIVLIVKIWLLAG